MILLYHTDNVPFGEPKIWKVIKNNLSSDTMVSAVRKYVKEVLIEPISIRKEIQHTFKQTGPVIAYKQCSTIQSELVLYNEDTDAEIKKTVILHACEVDYTDSFISNFR